MLTRYEMHGFDAELWERKNGNLIEYADVQKEINEVIKFIKENQDEDECRLIIQKLKEIVGEG